MAKKNNVHQKKNHGGKRKIQDVHVRKYEEKADVGHFWRGGGIDEVVTGLKGHVGRKRRIDGRKAKNTL